MAHLRKCASGHLRKADSGHLMKGGEECCAEGCETAGPGTSIDVTFAGLSAVCGCAQVPNSGFTGCNTSAYIQGVSVTLNGTYTLPWVSSGTFVETYALIAEAGTNIAYKSGTGGACTISGNSTLTIAVDIRSSLSGCLIGRIAAFSSSFGGCAVAFAYTDSNVSAPNVNIGDTVNNAACGTYLGFSYGNNGVIAGVVLVDGGTATVDSFNP